MGHHTCVDTLWAAKMIAHGLDRATIAELLEADPPLVQGYVDLAAQLQPNGFDLTLGEVAAFTEPGVVGATNAQRRLAEAAIIPFGDDGLLRLEPGTLPHHLQRGGEFAA